MEHLQQLLHSVSRVDFFSSSQDGSRTGWDGKGTGRVVIEVDPISSVKQIRLYETGEFKGDAFGMVTYRNTYRFDWLSDRIRLYHERLGADNAVWLVDLVLSKLDPRVLVSDSPHLCGDDTYNASLKLLDGRFVLIWDIRGPRKNEHIEYYYASI